MAIFLNENQVGADGAMIGFPSLGDCMGMVLVIGGRLHGFHHMPNPAERASAFREAIKKAGDDVGDASRLYGCARFGRRYGGARKVVDAWRTEMTAIAGVLGYSGSVCGVNLSKASHVPKDSKANETVYLEYQRQGETCAIRYKRMAKMAATRGNRHEAHGIQQVRRDPKSVDGAVMLAAPHMGVIVDMALDTSKTKSAAGVMHAAGSILRFEV